MRQGIELPLEFRQMDNSAIKPNSPSAEDKSPGSGGLPNNKIIITCAITGHRTTRAMARNLPLSPSEQAQAAQAALAAGASIIHLHVRDDDGEATLQPERYHQAIYNIKEQAPQAIIEVSLRGMDYQHNLAEKIDRGNLALLNPAMWGYDEKLKPSLCALNISTRNIGHDTILINSLYQVEAQAAKIYEYGLIPRCDVYDSGDILVMRRLINAGILKLPVHVLLIFGSYSGIGASKAELEFMLHLLPEQCFWTALGSGSANFSLAALALEQGGNLRTGFEDSTYLERGVKAESNQQMVAKMVALCRQNKLAVATPAEAKQILEL